MKKCLNLVNLDRKRNDISKKEMSDVLAGITKPSEQNSLEDSCSCASWLIATDCGETDSWRGCDCGSIFVVIGLFN